MAMLIRETHRIQTKPGAYGFLAGLLVMLLGLVVNASCTHAADAREVEVVTPMRTPAQRTESAVTIYTTCGRGSGVLIDGRHVLTAQHVVNCEVWPKVEISEAIVVQTVDGEAYVAQVEVDDGSRDLARLKLDMDIPDVAPVRFGFLEKDDVACAYTMVPERAVRCGVVGSAGGKPRSHGDIKMRSGNFWFGNSGSGVYDDDGRLVGILVRLQWCSDADAFMWQLVELRPETCGGRISSVIDSPVLG